MTVYVAFVGCKLVETTTDLHPIIDNIKEIFA